MRRPYEILNTIETANLGGENPGTERHDPDWLDRTNVPFQMKWVCRRIPFHEKVVQKDKRLDLLKALVLR